jgi:alpha-amylase/alpha-mannosidase (GH57 family)
MAEKHLKQYSKPLVIMEMQIKMTLRFHLTPIRMAKIKKKKKKTQAIADTGEDVKKEEHSSIVGGIANWYNHAENQSGGSSENWK